MARNNLDEIAHHEVRIFDGEGNLKKVIPSKTIREVLKEKYCGEATYQLCFTDQKKTVFTMHKNGATRTYQDGESIYDEGIQTDENN